MKKLFFLALMFVALSPFTMAQGATKSSATLTQTVNPAASIAAKVTLVSSANPSAIGQVVTYSGTVTGTNNGTSPTGTVTVVGATGTQTVTLTAAGTYTCSETTTKAGSFNVTATYGGDVNFF